MPLKNERTLRPVIRSTGSQNCLTVAYWNNICMRRKMPTCPRYPLHLVLIGLSVPSKYADKRARPRPICARQLGSAPENLLAEQPHHRVGHRHQRGDAGGHRRSAAAPALRRPSSPPPPRENRAQVEKQRPECILSPAAPTGAPAAGACISSRPPRRTNGFPLLRPAAIEVGNSAPKHPPREPYPLARAITLRWDGALLAALLRSGLFAECRFSNTLRERSDLRSAASSAHPGGSDSPSQARDTVLLGGCFGAEFHPDCGQARRAESVGAARRPGC